MNNEYDDDNLYDEYGYDENGYNKNGFTKEDYEDFALAEKMLAQHGSPERDRLIDGIDLEFNIITSDVDNAYEYWGTTFNKSIYYPIKGDYIDKPLPLEQITIKFILSWGMDYISYYFMFADAIKSLYVDFIDQECVKDKYDDSAECISCSRENWSEKCDDLFMDYQSQELPINKYLALGNNQIKAIYENMTDQEIELIRKFGDEYDGLNLLAMLLMVRIEQLKDSTAFYLLAKLEYYDFKGYMAVKLLLLFLNDPVFFIQQVIKYKAHHLFETLAYYFAKVFTLEYFFIEYRTELNIKLKAGQLFVYPPSGNPNWIEHEYEYGATDNLKQILASRPTVPAHFTPIKTEENLRWWKESFPTWQEGVINFPDFGDYWGKDLLSKLTEEERVIYDKYIYPGLQEKIIRNYHVNSSDGLAYLKKEPNDKSETLRVLANDEYVCFLEDKSGWVKVYYPFANSKDGLGGYIHSSQLEQR